jgi:hypothetical protein
MSFHILDLFRMEKKKYMSRKVRKEYALRLQVAKKKIEALYSSGGRVPIRSLVMPYFIGRDDDSWQGRLNMTWNEKSFDPQMIEIIERIANKAP